MLAASLKGVIAHPSGMWVPETVRQEAFRAGQSLKRVQANAPILS